MAIGGVITTGGMISKSEGVVAVDLSKERRGTVILTGEPEEDCVEGVFGIEMNGEVARDWLLDRASSSAKGSVSRRSYGFWLL